MAIWAQHGTAKTVVGTGDITLATSVPGWASRAFAIVWGTAWSAAASDCEYWRGTGRLIDADTLRVRFHGADAAPREKASYCVVWCDQDEFTAEWYERTLEVGETLGTVRPSMDITDTTRVAVVGTDRTLEVVPRTAAEEVYARHQLGAGVVNLLRAVGTSYRLRCEGYLVKWAPETGVECATSAFSLSGNMAGGINTSIAGLLPSTPAAVDRMVLTSSVGHATAGLEQNSIARRIVNTSNVQWERSVTTTSYQSYGAVGLMHFPTGGFASQHLRLGGIVAGAATASIPMTAVGDLQHAVLMDANWSSSGTGTAQARNSWTAYLGSTTSVDLTRYYTGQAAEACACVADFTLWKFHRQPHVVGRAF